MNDVQSHRQPSTPESARPDRDRFNWWRWFWIALLVASLPYAWYCFYVPSNDIAWADNFSSAQQHAAQSGKPVIIYFTGKWCVPCRIMKRNVWADQEVTSLVNSGFIPVMIDVDDPDSASTRSRYGVGATPSTVITDRDGNLLQQKAGGMTKAEFLEMLGNFPSSAGKHLW